MNPAEILGVERERWEVLPTLTAPLLAWYDHSARDLPWRRDPTPYRVWISEIMLQQTRVEAAKDYYRRFLAEVPDVERLAALPEDRLLKLWEGLGYYNRARNLQRAAVILMERHGGELPPSYEELRALPGIGDYTAGAIASIAFALPVPAVDGNVLRVLARLLGSEADIAKPAVKKAVREAVASMQPGDRPGDFTQALMELGATVCVPGGPPLCRECPLRDGCAARLTGRAESLPVKSPAKARRVEERTLLFLTAGDKLLLFRRGKGLLSGMYEPVNLLGDFGAHEALQAVRAMGGDPAEQDLHPLGEAKHVFSHVEWRMRGYRVETGEFPVPGGVWARAARREEFPLPSAFRYYFQALSTWAPDGEKGE